MRQQIVLTLIIHLLCLSFTARAFGFSATGEKIEVSSCTETICYNVYSASIVTSQLMPLWSLTDGRLEVWTRGQIQSPHNSTEYSFTKGIWDQASHLYTLRTAKSELVFDTQSGKIKAEQGL